MQKVERKQHRFIRHRKAGWLILCAVLLCGAVTAALLLKKQETEPEKEPVIYGGTLVNRSAEEVSSVTVTRRDGETWTAEREEDGSLTPEGEQGWTVDRQLGDMLLDAMVHLEYEYILTDRPEEYTGELSAFGLDRPLVTVVCRYRDGEETEVRIGNPVAGEEEELYYMTVAGDDRLFAASEGTARDLNVEKALLHPVTQPRILSALLDRITVTGPDGTPTAEWRLQGEVTDTDAAENWLVTAPFEYPADSQQMEQLKKNAGNLRMGTWYGPANAENLKACGLEHPRESLEFHTAAGSTGTVSEESGVYDVQDWEEQTVTLEMGDDRDEIVTWFRFGDEIFAVSRVSYSAFTETDPLDTAARYPVATPLEVLQELTVEGDGETVVYTFEERTDGEADGSRICRKNGEEIPYETFEAAYERLRTVTVSGKLPENTGTGEARKKYTFRTTNGGTHILTLWPFDDLHDGVTLDGHTLFYLIRNGMTELP